jgi:hypothetical protein
MSHTDELLIRIDGVDLPGLSCAGSPESPGGYHNIHVAVQHRNRGDDLLGLTPGNAAQNRPPPFRTSRRRP